MDLPITEQQQQDISNMVLDILDDSRMYGDFVDQIYEGAYGKLSTLEQLTFNKACEAGDKYDDVIGEIVTRTALDFTDAGRGHPFACASRLRKAGF